jgi:pimeloyl-ACP methyl ester carboxylesterase
MTDDTAEIWLERADARLYAVADGHGLPVILLHGGLANHASCRAFAAPLVSRYRLITPDLRASGRSRFAGALDWDLFADDIAALADHLAIERAVVGGISFGAGCAARVALRHPDRIAGLVLLHPAYGGAELGLSPAQIAAMRAMADAGERALVDGMRALDPLLDTLPAELRERARATVATYDPASVAALTRFMASGVQPFARATELATIAAPVLVVPGEDPTHPRDVASLLHEHLPRCTLRDAANSDFASTIEDFIEREVAVV